MTHDKKILNRTGSFSPLSLENAEISVSSKMNAQPSTQLEITLEKVVMQEGKEYLSALLEENGARTQNDKVVPSTITKTTSCLWTFGLMHTTPRV
jgi:hypothetical protein